MIKLNSKQIHSQVVAIEIIQKILLSESSEIDNNEIKFGSYRNNKTELNGKVIYPFNNIILDKLNYNFPLKVIGSYGKYKIKLEKHNYFSKNIGENENRKCLVKNAINTAENIGAKVIITFTNTGFMSKTAAAFRPNLPIFNFTFSDTLAKKLSILFGTQTFLINEKTQEENIQNAISKLKEKNLIKLEDQVVVVYGGKRGNEIIPSIQIITVK